MKPSAELSSPASRALVIEHERIVAEQADRHALTLEAVLAILRSTRLDDRAARALAVETAAAALVVLRTSTDQQRSALLEPVTGAFARLRTDLRPLVRHGDLDVQFVEPPATGRALPGEVAHEARAIVRSAVLALLDRGTPHRVRIQWDCDGLNLLIGIRDDGAGTLTAHDDSLGPIVERVSALNGAFDVASTPGWGSELSVVLPLDPPPRPDFLDEAVDLSPRESEVLSLVVAGSRNRAIAERLGISENTAKFHVSNLLRKAGVSTRAELAALGTARAQ
ncbi:MULTISPECIES: helix-turn-helix transcriptional regulator [Microbacterium]|uniref:helix-turn-helix transcriptional regulator n=1 Tax=Microbacterium TaxID=33882 RepID=UPI000E3A850E|nr:MULTISPECIES: helix-turn-helix transcriptional regulator [Microbacterium]MDZ5143527.1 helix-turn-helix transcriptional regulator [Microbacterium testaceum]REC99631.1 regulatory LuxR family protein [Microbacterium sp. AG157]WJS91662.1 helix-turn-helix transcriptional regulator [Microbacterium testaceum]